jgi:hypothetical protein
VKASFDGRAPTEAPGCIGGRRARLPAIAYPAPLDLCNHSGHLAFNFGLMVVLFLTNRGGTVRRATGANEEEKRKSCYVVMTRPRSVRCRGPAHICGDAKEVR